MVGCCFVLPGVPPVAGRSLCRLPGPLARQSKRSVTEELASLYMQSPSKSTSPSRVGSSVNTLLRKEVPRPTCSRTSGWPVNAAFGRSVASLQYRQTRGLSTELNMSARDYVPSLGTTVLFQGRHSIHSIAANLQRSPVISGQDTTAVPSNRSPAAAREVQEAPTTAPVDANTSCPEDPADVSYAQELLQHIREITATAAKAKDGDGAVASSEWFVDWLLTLKLGLGVPWCVALPAAGCLLRLLTLPIAIDSERDRRQRQLVDPQFSRLKEKMKMAHEAGNTQEYQRLRIETKQFLKKHGIGVLPTSLFQMLLLGVAISLSTPAIRAMAGDPDRWRGFAVEQPGWLESLALPDSSGLTAVLCWLVLVSTMAAGWMVSSKIQKRTPSAHMSSTLSSPLVMRGASVGAATIFALYSGMQLPAAAVLFLVPAFVVQSAFMRIFRLRSVESALRKPPSSSGAELSSSIPHHTLLDAGNRSLIEVITFVILCVYEPDFVPEGLRPLQQTYLALLERREPALAAAWKRRASDLEYSEKVAEATAGGADVTSRAIVQLWKELAQKEGVAAPQHLKTWAEQVAEKQLERLSQAAMRQCVRQPQAHGTEALKV
ncbi:hypothetical protein cyc_01748 [Cyclospora cayetanensis]|uniref:Uncharacterized protein n=1 Tax=Cyclospora cayetanensis TaxID=88456 RepID=A0A1D3CS57_9EIME|nr:hypothetical protein cyc_01748 [Cyclospora cayetanensis]